MTTYFSEESAKPLWTYCTRERERYEFERGKREVEIEARFKVLGIHEFRTTVYLCIKLKYIYIELQVFVLNNLINLKKTCKTVGQNFLHLERALKIFNLFSNLFIPALIRSDFIAVSLTLKYTCNYLSFKGTNKISW